MSTSTEDEPPAEGLMDIHPTSSAGGVFGSRVCQRKISIHGKKNTETKEIDLEVASVSDTPEVEERDFHKKQVIQLAIGFLLNAGGCTDYGK
jgi:hypothetical protein